MDNNKEEAIVIQTGHYSSTAILTILPNTDEYMEKAKKMVEYLNKCYNPNDPDNDYARIEIYPFGRTFVPSNRYPYKVTIFRWTTEPPLSERSIEWMKKYALMIVPNNQNMSHHMVEAMDVDDLEMGDIVALEADLAGKNWEDEYDACVIDGRNGKHVFRCKLVKKFMAASPETALNIAYDDLNTWCYENMADFKPYNWGI